MRRSLAILSGIALLAVGTAAVWADYGKQPEPKEKPVSTKATFVIPGIK